MLAECTFGVGRLLTVGARVLKLFIEMITHKLCTEFHVKPPYDDKLSLRFLLLIDPVQKTSEAFTAAFHQRAVSMFWPYIWREL